MRILLIALVALAACSHKPAKNEPPPRDPANYTKAADMPIEDFFKNPVLFGYRISPDGKMFALLKPWKNRLNVFVHPVGEPQNQRQITFNEDRDIHQIMWKNGDYLLFEKDNGGDENTHVFAVKVSTGQTKDLTPYAGAKSDVADMLEEASTTDVLIQNNQRNKEVFDIFRVNVETGETKLLAENRNTINTWLVDHDGNVRGGVASDGVNAVFYYEKSKDKGFEPIFKTDFRNNFEPIAFTADNKRLFVNTNLGRNLNAIVEIDPLLPSNKFIKRTVFSHPKYDVSGASYSPVRKSLGMVTVITDRRTTKFMNAKDQKDWDFVRHQFPKEELLFANDTLDEGVWVFKTHSDVTMGAYYSFDRKARKVTALGATAPWIRPELMSTMKTVHFKSRDGLNIEGYLTIPRGSAGKNLPTIVNPHGGPWARDEWGFNPEVQWLASRGFAVFQLNFRGSTGYGRTFWEASFKQWGKTMQNDITDGVQWLIKKGVADSKKVCIYGASYGGYATLAGVTFTPDLYACAVDYVGVSNLLTFMNTIPPYWKPFLEMMYVQVGNPHTEKAMLESASPVNFIDRIKTPLFVAQGANDPRVNKAESDQIVDGLRKRGVEVEYMVKENEGHGFHNEENRFDFYRAMEKFLNKHLGPAQAAASATSGGGRN